MSSMFAAMFSATGSPLLDQQFGELVTLHRGNRTTTNVTASWTADAETLVSPDGQHTQVVDRTWLVKQSAYLIAAAAVEPRTSYRLTDSTGAIWEVLPSMAGPAVTAIDDGEYWEIKTKRVSS